MGYRPLHSKSFSIRHSLVLLFDTLVCIRKGIPILDSWRSGINDLHVHLFGTIDESRNFGFQYNQTAMCRMLERVKGKAVPLQAPGRQRVPGS